MTVSPSKVLASILDRVAEPSDRPEAVFLAEEVECWPAGALRALLATKLFTTALPAETITCLGCEERCLRPVTILAEDAYWGPALSTCHLYPRMGPFHVRRDRLERWTSSRRAFAVFLGRVLQLAIRHHDDRWRRVRFSTLQFAGLRRAFSIEFQDSPMATIGPVRVPLLELLDLNACTVTVDREALAMAASMSEDLQSGNKRVQPSKAIREEHKLLTAIKHRRVQFHMEALARQHPNLNKEQLAKKLARSSDGQGMSWGRIARVTRMPPQKK